MTKILYLIAGANGSGKGKILEIANDALYNNFMEGIESG